MFQYITFIVGFFLLIKGADYLVKAAKSLAKSLKISPLIVGLTVVAFGTTLPELSVNIAASLNGTTDVALGNIVGSLIANILLILGVGAIIFPLKVEWTAIKKEIPFSIVAVFVLLISATDGFVRNNASGILERAEGMIYLCIFALFICYVYLLVMQQRKDLGKHMVSEKQHYLITILMMIGGTIGLYVGGKWVVDGAVLIARNLGLSEFLISSTIIAVGTSLPEFATAITAAVKRSTEIAVGNIIGSNILDVFWILGISAVIRPIPISKGIIFDIIFALFATLLFIFFMYNSKNNRIVRWEGMTFVLIYIVYLLFNIYRG